MQQISHYHHHPVAHAGQRPGEKVVVQITAVTAALGISELVKQVELLPLLGADIFATKGLQAKTLLRHTFAFAPQALAFAAGEACEEVFKTAVAIVVTVKLGGCAPVQPRLQQLAGNRFFWK